MKRMQAIGKRPARQVASTEPLRFGKLSAEAALLWLAVAMLWAAQPGADNASNRNSINRSSEPQGQELVYAARISLDRTQMQVEDKLVNLTPGMAVTVEIKTGSRRLIEYVLSPLLRYKQESLRER